MDSCTILCRTAEKTRFSGSSLAQTLYPPLPTVGLQGPMGTGKTTFTQGLAEALGVTIPLTSPTFALEQRYATGKGLLIHLDLYRLPPKQIQEVLRASDEEQSLRLIEWSDRSEHGTLNPDILLTFKDHPEGREIDCEFRDVRFPSLDQIRTWQKEFLLPDHLIRHCDAVMRATEIFTDHLLERGHIVRPVLAKTAALVHDLFRFLDFRPEGHRPEFPKNSKEQYSVWDIWRERYNLSHEAACAAFLREKGYEVLASVVETHGVKAPPGETSSTEQRLVYYADKRVKEDQPATLDERYEDFRSRYSGGQPPSDLQLRWLTEAKTCEAVLFPGGAPKLW